MKYYMPVMVYDEENAVRNHAADLSAFGTKALLVTGKHAALQCGALDDVRTALQETGTACCLFSDIEENPSVETIARAAAFGESEGVDFVVGIGGGSPMDAAKAIAFLLKAQRNGEGDAEPEKILYNASLPTEYLPVVLIPTTCGTGSEVTGVSVLTLHRERTKKSIPHKVFASLALIDGRYLAGAPHGLIVSTAVDALAHMLESSQMTSSNEYSMAHVMAGLSLWSKERDVLSGDREPAAGDLTALMRASAFAGMAIAQTGTSIPHALSYILTYEEKIAHGRACGYFLPAFMAEVPKEERMVLLKAAGFSELHAFEEFMSRCMERPKVSEQTLRLAFEAVSANTQRLKSCRIPMTEEKLMRIAGI